MKHAALTGKTPICSNPIQWMQENISLSSLYTADIDTLYTIAEQHNNFGDIEAMNI
jgi:hypothetical protein